MLVNLLGISMTDREAVSRLRNIAPVTLRDQVFDEIQLAILEKRLKPGDRIREQELTRLLNVSRTPVREALVLLERDGLVSTIPNRGAYVRQFNEQDIREIFTMRNALEDLAADLSISRIDDEHLAEMEANIASIEKMIGKSDRPSQGKLDLEFHRYLVSLSDNSRLIKYWRVIAVQYTAVSRYLDYTNFDQRTVIKDHRSIIDAYRSHDLDKIHAVNRSINDAVVALCIEGYRTQAKDD